ncbi:Fcf1-domain-containing protein [Scheffersomyces xylosifermentans]|uniref:Fcf1-domain-containing protein n=1 Tax=Scheffersomyces xylosifermentans TaxID=1304137 RepID=UPI00315DD6E6
MRQKRAKAYKRQMNVYLHTFKFREPFQTIVDSEIVLNCEKASFDIVKGLNRTIQGETKPMITQCCMQALYDSKNQSAIDIAKKFERRRCNHREAIDPVECVLSIVDIKGENKHRYVVAGQNYDLRIKLRRVPGVPLIFMNRSVMVMEPMSQATARATEIFERKKLTKGLNDAKYAGVANDEEEKNEKGEENPQSKKRKGPKGPNPLSVKKKKTEQKTTAAKGESGEKKPRRKRTHKKVEDGESTTGDGNDKNGEEQNTNEVASEEKH